MGFIGTPPGLAGEDQATREKFLKILQRSQRMLRLVSDQLSPYQKLNAAILFPRQRKTSLTQAVERVRVTASHQIWR